MTEASHTAQPEEFLPLTTVAFEILLSLAEGEHHGYAIMRDIEERAGGIASLHAGTLYRALNRLLDSGLLVELDSPPDPAVDDERRRYYALTSLGRTVATAEARRLEAQVGAARARKLLRHPRTA